MAEPCAPEAVGTPVAHLGYSPPAELADLGTSVGGELTLWRRAVVEALGTAFLLATVVGSRVLADRLAAGDAAMALLANSLTTAAVLYALINWMGPLSGAHLNPLVTLALSDRSSERWTTVAVYVVAQIGGAVLGVCCANAMFDLPLLAIGIHARTGGSQLLSEFVTSFGLLGAVVTCARTRSSATAGVVAAYVGGAFWFTATGFGNPAVAIARGLADGNVGIRPADIPGFLVAEVAGGMSGAMLFRWLLQGIDRPATPLEIETVQ